MLMLVIIQTKYAASIFRAEVNPKHADNKKHNNPEDYNLK
jgi:hypothetical protein